MTVADTDVLIDFLAGTGVSADRVAELLAAGVLHTTVISRFELLAGSRNARQQERILKLLAAVPALPLNTDGADCAARIRQGLERRGQPIGMADSLIAGIVIANHGRLLTRNRRHFERVPGLHLAEL